jgi:hypothetical protein
MATPSNIAARAIAARRVINCASEDSGWVEGGEKEFMVRGCGD